MLRFLPVLYWLVALIHLAGVILNHEMVAAVTKPLLMIVLGVYYFMATSQNRTVPHKFILAGFVFSWSGDVNLMFVHINENFFLLGLVSFLITHVLYIMSFRKDSVGISGPRILKVKPYLASPVLFAYLALLVVLFPHIQPDMKIPVIVYATVITVMVLAALDRYKKVSDQGFWLVFAGAVLFMISDSMIAINKFYQPFEAASAFIMLTYITSQYLIAKGSIKPA